MSLNKTRTSDLRHFNVIQCIAPKSAEGYVDVEVSMNLIDYSSSSVQFKYQAVVLIASTHYLGRSWATLPSCSLASAAAPCVNCYINKDLWCALVTPRVPTYYDLRIRSATSRLRTACLVS